MNNYQKFAFFGASVTKQADSYADKLMIDLKKEYKKFGYGSMHLDDAGICFIDEVIEYKPDVCFIDWFSTAKTNYGNNISTYLNTILYKLLNNNIKPIFLLLPISEMVKSRLEMYKNVKQYALDYNINCIDVYEQSLTDNIPVSDLIKDYVHTTNFGSDYYANTMLTFLNHFILQLPDEPLGSNYNIVYPHKNKYVNINKTTINKTVYKNFSILVEGEVIGFYQTIGPYSGDVEIYKNDILIEKQPVWDVWCYYERDTFKIQLKEPGEYMIRIVDCSRDRSKSKVQADWDSFKKEIRIKDIYHTSNIVVKDYE
jgi:hypothetical protein